MLTDATRILTERLDNSVAAVLAAELRATLPDDDTPMTTIRRTLLSVYVDEWRLPDADTLRFYRPAGIDGRPTITVADVEPAFYALPAVTLDLGAGVLIRLDYIGARVAAQDGGLSYPLNAWRGGRRGSRDTLLVMADYKFSDEHGPMFHISLSYPRHSPSYKEIKAARAAFFYDAETVAQVFPPSAEYVNDHPFCHHLWTLPIARWGVTP